MPDFDYTARPAAKLEIPIAERIAAIRKMKSEQRARSAMKNARANGPKAGAKECRVARAGLARPRGAGGPGGGLAGEGAAQAAAAGRGEEEGTSDHTGVIFRRSLVACMLLLAAGCDAPYAYRMVTRLQLEARRVHCCGATDFQDITVPDEPDVAIGLSQVALAERVGGQDLWLTKTHCEQLFDGPDPEPGTGPRATPLCEVLCGPRVAWAGKHTDGAAPGRYRVFARAYSTNTAANDYRVDLEVWATACEGSPVRP